MLEVGNLVKYLPMTSAWVEILVHWGGNHIQQLYLV